MKIQSKKAAEQFQYRREAIIYFFTGIWPDLTPKRQCICTASGKKPITLSSSFRRTHNV